MRVESLAVILIYIYAYTKQDGIQIHGVDALLSKISTNGLHSLGQFRHDEYLKQQDSRTALFLNDFFNFGKQKKEGAESKEDKERETAISMKKQREGNEEKFLDGAYDESDPVEKIFSFFFGEREENPMGMSRFGPDRFPEQYPATKTEWALPIASDSTEMAMLRPLLKNTNLESRGLKLSYDANRDGWNAESFHRAVDKKGGSVVLCKTRSGVVCGGYNPKGWVGYGEARGSIAAFLFILGGEYANADGTVPGIKLRKVGGPGLAQMDMPENGPSFGADSLVIPLGKNSPRLARSKLGSYYERLPNGGSSLFGEDSSVQLKELKVYQGVYEKDEFIPFTDAEPFALY